jgi:uncharacterized membrane protein YphA (DoxX/SURF4 family)
MVLFPQLGIDMESLLPTEDQFHPLTFLPQIAPAIAMFLLLSGLLTRIASVSIVFVIGHALFYSKFGLNISDLETPLVYFFLASILLVDGAGRISVDSRFTSLFNRSK